MDFFGDVATFLDDIIPEEGEVGKFFDTALSRLGDTSTGTSKSGAASATGIYNNLQNNSNALAVKEAIRRNDQEDPLQSVDPRQIQREWFERLSTFSQEA